MQWGAVAATVPEVAAARMTTIASAEMPWRIRSTFSFAAVVALAGVATIAFVPGPRLLFAMLLVPVVTVAIAFGFLTAMWTLGLALGVGTLVLPPLGAPFVIDPGYPEAVSIYLVEGGVLAALGAVAHTALRTPPPATDRLPGPPPNPPPAPARVPARTVDPLTPREVEVLRLAASGRGVDELAEELIVSRNTVKTHLAHAYDKLGAHNRAGAVACALAEGWFDAADVADVADAVEDDGIASDPHRLAGHNHPTG